jgi:uncharacterized membrane protein YuzA (DUF378 family)
LDPIYEQPIGSSTPGAVRDDRAARVEAPTVNTVRPRRRVSAKTTQLVVAKESPMKAFDAIAAGLVIVGAVNWGLVGMARFNLVAAIFGQTILASIVYSVVGLAGVYLIGRWATSQKPVLAHQ